MMISDWTDLPLAGGLRLLVPGPSSPAAEACDVFRVFSEKEWYPGILEFVS